MTARQQIRTGSAATAPETWSIETQRAPHVGEILQTARERKGLDLVRAERETKIRARHLMALESGDFDDLPAPVYAKGFLRNYSLYLGLDPDEMLARWRREVDRPRAAETVKVAPPPQPITAPRQGFKFTSGLLVAVILSLIVAGFVGFVGLQLVRFSQNPELSLRGPSVRWLSPEATRIVLGGTGSPNARITATGAGDLVRTVTADPSGDWTIELPVAKGRNDFVVMGLDLETGRESDPLQVIATVPVGEVVDPDARPTPALPTGTSAESAAGVPSAQVSITSPKHRGIVRDGKVRLRGRSDAPTVLVSFQWLGKKDAAPRAPEPVELPVTGGTFKGTFTLPPGKWQVAAAGQNDGGSPAVATSTVRSAYDGIVTTIRAVDGYTRINITADGEVVSSGIRLQPGEEETFRATEEMTVRVGNARAAHITVDGVDYGAMGKTPEAKSWQLEAGQEPKALP